MHRPAFIFLLFFVFLVPAKAQNIRSVDKDGLSLLMSKKNDTVYVINFWATWCSPCVQELPFFEELHKSSSGRKLQVVLVNLDFPKQLMSRVYPFVNENTITAPVLNMTSLDYNSWIPAVYENWSGEIPATLIFRNEKRNFFAGELSREELFENVESLLEE